MTPLAVVATAVAPFAIEMVRIGGQSLRVGRRAGSGAPLLMFNGIGANIEVLAPLAPLMRGRELITFDVPGVGHSALPTANQSEPARASPHRNGPSPCFVALADPAQWGLCRLASRYW